MRVKLTHNLQPHEQEAHSVIVEDALGNPILVVMQVGEAIMYAQAGDKDFHSFLKALGVDKTVVVDEIKPKPVDNVIWTP